MITTRFNTGVPRKLLNICQAKKLDDRLRFRSVSNEEYTEKAEYPPILNLSPEETRKRKLLSDHEKLRRLNTVEEKLFAVNLPRYWGWDSLILKEGNIPYNVLPFMQYITRTKFIASKNLPIISIDDNLSDKVLNQVRPLIQEAIILELVHRRHLHDLLDEKLSDTAVSNILAKSIIEHIHRILLTTLSSEFPHLQDTETDYDPRVEAFWKVGNFYPDNELYEKRKEDRKNQRKAKKNEIIRTVKHPPTVEPEEYVEHWIQYFGEPCLQLRHTLPLAPLRQEVTEVKQDGSSEGVADSTPPEVVYPVKQHRYDPSYYGIEKDKRHGTNIPGFWPGDPNEFGLLSYHTRGHLLGRPPQFGAKDMTEALYSQALLAGYSWLSAQASYQGFNTFNELTYPLTTSTVITDGRVFSFYASQLNTLLMHSNHTDNYPKENVCYGTNEMELFKHVDGGQIFGWNDAPLKTLLSFYANVPSERYGVNLKPNLNDKERYICDIEDEKRRTWLHRQFRHMYANRPRKLQPYEIFDWENIYKIKFETRFHEARRRPFELGKDPLVERKYSDHVGQYIKKSLRDPLTKKKKFEDTYYPDV